MSDKLFGTRYLIFDITNILYKTFFVHKNEEDVTVAGMAHHSALTTINKYYKNLRPNKIVMAFDRSSWRKEYTASEKCLSKRPYKGNRRQQMTQREKEKYQLFLQHIADFEVMIRDHTSITTLANTGLEADDLIAGFVQIFHAEPDAEVIIVSADKDLIQLLRYPNVRLIDPATGKDRTLDEWNGDADYFIFEKCIRGDRGDNVMSAFPKIRGTKIKEAYDASKVSTEADKYVNLMQSTFQHIDGNTMVVKDLFKENQLLMDLCKQPPEIKDLIVSTIIDSMENTGKFSYFHFMKFLGKYELKKIADQAELFVKMLSC